MDAFLWMKQNKLLLVIMLSLSGVNAFAQFGGGMGGMGGMGGKRSGGYERSGRGENPRSQNSETPMLTLNNSDQLLTRLGTLQFDLKMTEAQLQPWLLFEGKVRTYIEDLEREKIKSIPVPAGEVQAAGFLTGMAYLSKMVDSVRNRYADLEDIEAAAKGLHLILTPAQKIIFDARIPSILVKDIGR